MSSNIKRIQPDQYCPQNQLVDIKVFKEQDSVNTDIALIDWDLNCQSPPATPSTVKSSPSPEEFKKNIDLQLHKFFNLLKLLPESNLRIKSVNLDSELINKKLSFSLQVNKTAQQLLITLSGELLKVNIKLDLNSRDLTLDGFVTLDLVADYVNISEQVKPLLNNALEINYQSNLNHWQQGGLSVNWAGMLANNYAEQAEFRLTSELQLLKRQAVVNELAVNLKKVTLPLSEQQEWKTGYIKLKLAAPALINLSPELNIKALPLHLRIGSSALLSKVPRGKSRRIRIDTQKLPSLFMTLAPRGTVADIKADWSLSSLNQTISGNSSYSGQKVHFDIAENTLSAKILIDSLGRYITDLEVVLLKSGEIKLQMSADYDLKTNSGRLQSSVNVLSLSGEQSNVLFDGVNFSSDLDYSINNNLVTVNQDKQQLKIDSLFVGIPVQALQLDAQINAGDPLIQHFKARLLGGRVDFDDLQLTPPGKAVIAISGISLSEVIKYSSYPEIKGKGVLDGMLPLSLNKSGPTVAEGLVFARAPGGYIKVPENTVITAMSSGNPAFSFTMQLLSNFQFDTLQAVIGYTSDGESDLKVEIKGINPTVSGTQPITFNYSHKENILKLLQSLRFNDELVRQIKERY
ncbi:intermembrane phospholipid transport protein YdbH family protein [Psychromonas aquimarina]|uniref:intermembrane phospholipid transport protein YdbH family protein n=1 Tax=Psychromonas aquimarina TaxID=444919 RepID=UPI000411210B|nr:YdbH domain-containing protein [Psychromonas aquimarina]